MTAMAAKIQLRGAGLWPWALFSGLIAAAGLPIYIHAPKFYVDNYGIGLGALGAALFVLRLIDVVQDPLLGWLSDRQANRRGVMVAVALVLMAGAMIALFAVAPPFAPLLWFSVTLIVLFSAYSFLTISFYAEGVRKAGTLSGQGHLRLAGWREAGGLVGVSLAAVAPALLGQIMPDPFTGFAIGFAVLALAAGWAMRRDWIGMRSEATSPLASIGPILSDPITRRLLLIALVNAMPVAVTSTLFLFFVESRLDAPDAAGPLLLLFFLSAAIAAPLWSHLARRVGARRALVAGMSLAILAFLSAAGLGAGDAWPFALICMLSGAALGADLTLLPAVFSRRLAAVAPQAGMGFGLWNFVSKLTLALAAAGTLPLLERAGFVSGGENPPEALLWLTLLYAVLPCALKVAAIGLVLTARFEEDMR